MLLQLLAVAGAALSTSREGAVDSLQEFVEPSLLPMIRELQKKVHHLEAVQLHNDALNRRSTAHNDALELKAVQLQADVKALTSKLQSLQNWAAAHLNYSPATPEEQSLQNVQSTLATPEEQGSIKSPAPPGGGTTRTVGFEKKQRMLELFFAALAPKQIPLIPQLLQNFTTSQLSANFMHRYGKAPNWHQEEAVPQLAARLPVRSTMPESSFSKQRRYTSAPAR